MFFSRCASPVGSWLMLSDGAALTGLYPESHRAVPEETDGWRRDDAHFSGVVDQLKAWFAGHLTHFNVPLAMQGSVFARRVWAALREIPPGATVTYGALAAHLGQPSAARAVGAANGRNPVSLIVPCHRVIGADGSLTGYAGGTQLKAWLLEHEATMARRQRGGLTPPSTLAAVARTVSLAV